MNLTFPYKADAGFDALCGLVLDAASEDQLTAHIPVTDDLKQPAGVVHGGVYAAVAETAASVGTLLIVDEQGHAAMGLSNHTSFMRPVTDGTIHAVASVRHRGRATWVWEVELRDDDDRLCALSRVTMAVH